jgi:hypothetical protein
MWLAQQNGAPWKTRFAGIGPSTFMDSQPHRILPKQAALDPLGTCPEA